MPSITIIGSLNYDLVTYTNKIPQGGETYQANSFETHVGGKGLNESIAVAKLTPKNSVLLSSTSSSSSTTTTTTSGDGDGAIRMVGKIGDDSFGQQLKQFLIDNKVNVDHVITVINQTSGVAIILVEQNNNGENRILIIPGANGELKLDDKEYETIFSKNKGNDEFNSFVILQNEYPDTIKSINWIKKNRPQLNIAYNPSPFKSELITKELLSKIDLLIVNEGEALDVANHLMKNSHQQDLIDQINHINCGGNGGGDDGGDNSKLLIEVFLKLAIELQHLINPHNVQVVIITMGSKGSIYIAKETNNNNNNNNPQFIEARKVEKVIDTTGAGDTFFGAIVLNLALGKLIDYAIKFATTASSLTIQKKGAAEGIPSYQEVIDNL